MGEKMNEETRAKLRKELEELSQCLNKNPEIEKMFPIGVPITFFCCKCCGKRRIVLQEELDVAYDLGKRMHETGNKIDYHRLYHLVFDYVTTCEKCRKLLFEEPNTRLAESLLSAH